MSQVISVKLKEMTKPETTERMLRKRLESLREDAQGIYGVLPHGMQRGTRHGLYVNYHKATARFSFDGDWRSVTQNRLNELYQIEEAIQQAESLGCSYQEFVDQDTGQVSLAIDDSCGQFQQLEQEAA